MLLAFARHEYRYAMRSVTTVALFTVLFGLSFLLTTNSSEFVDTARGGNVFINAPYMITLIMMLAAIFSIFWVPAYMADAVLKDVDCGFDGILFATPLRKSAFLGGRFLGAYAALMTVLSAVPLGLIFGGIAPWADPSTLAPLQLHHYAIVFFCNMAPSMLVSAAFIFSVAAITRRLIATYVTALAGLMLYLVVSETNLISPLWDPFMHRIFEDLTAYWTAAERNRNLIPMNSLVITNRLLWLSLAAVFYGIAYRTFSFRTANRPAKQPKHDREPTNQRLFKPTQTQPDTGPAVTWVQLKTQTLFEIRHTLTSFPFLVVLGLSTFLVVAGLLDREVYYGVNAYPLTHLMIEAITGANGWSLLAVLGFYSAEIIHRERRFAVAAILDAAPVPSWVIVTAKLLGLLMIMVSMLGLGTVLAISYQWIDGHVTPDLGLYVQRLILIYAVPYLFLAVLACFFQVAAPNRTIGMAMMGLFILATVGMNDLLGSEHPLFKYGMGGFRAPYTDMNGSGRFLTAVLWLYLYWSGIAGLLLTATYAIWPRGIRRPLFQRLRFGLTRGKAGLASACLVVTALSGAVIYFNTNILNQHLTSHDRMARRAAFEKRYAAWLHEPMPRVTAVETEVALFPHQGRVDTDGRYNLVNHTDQPIETVLVTFYDRLSVPDVALEGGRETERDPEFAVIRFALDPAMAPGEHRMLTFSTRFHRHGFTSGTPDQRLVRNGTFITNDRLTPHIGINPDLFLREADDRRDFDLPPRPPRPDLDDNQSHNVSVNRLDSDFIKFRTTISTVADQIALAPGELEKQWTEAGRNYFAYRMDVPMMHFYAYLSADYAVFRDQWDEVPIEIYYHAPHDYNLTRMRDAVKDSLTVFSQAFGPYQHDHFRIAEFPSYHSFAQSFAGLVPFSGSAGFVSQIKPGDIDLPYYVTAHETAHQWWGHQVTAANCQGASFLNETLSQYSALLVMEKRYGRDMIHKFLKHELDYYLTGRAKADTGEQPLYRVESQDYIHYRKGSLIMYALRDYLGADRINRVLRRLIELRGYQSRPYATSRDFLKLLREEAGPEYEGMIVDFFEKITLYDLAAEQAQLTRLDDGRYEVAVQVRAAKCYADALGNETQATFELPVDIGIFRTRPDDDNFRTEDVLLLEKVRLDQPSQTLRFTLTEEPRFIGIDPYHKLIDRTAADNVVAVD